MTMVEVTSKRQEAEDRAEYRQRMFVNILAASFITLMIITGIWVMNAVAAVH